MDYYIVENNKKTGPYDLVGIIRKIRNGSVRENTLIEEAGNKPVPAIEVGKLVEIFHEEAQDVAPDTRGKRVHTLKQSLSGGYHFVLDHLNVLVQAGAVLLLTILTFLPLAKVLSVYLAVPIAFGVFLFLMFIFSYLVLRMMRGQSSDLGTIFSHVGPRLRELGIAAAIITLPILLFVFALVVPGLIILSLYIFAPFLIVDRGQDFWEAMENSRKAVVSRGMDFFGLVFALVVINFVGIVLFVFPLVFTLPMTFYALAEIYDESF